MYELINLPYSKNELEPFMSSETLDFHHGKHLNAYVTFLNDFVANNKELEGKSVEELILSSHTNSQLQGLFNNAGQVYNHNEFFLCMKNNPNAKPTSEIASMINESFGSFEKFKEEFITAGKTLFGSGWVWLVVNKEGKLEIKKYENANNPLIDGLKGILTCDVWEHGYYIDYRNKRPDFLEVFINNLVNWDYVQSKL